MILYDKIKIKINKSNKSTYGKDRKIGDVVSLEIIQLSKGSNLIIDVSCDYCGDIYSMTYKRHIESTRLLNKHSCFKCKNLKSNEVSLLKYGVENVMFSEKFKQIQKNKIYEIYGVDNVFRLESIKEKSKLSLINKYGFDNYSKTEEYKEKSKITNIEKYGKSHISQTESFRKEKFKIDSHPNFTKYLKNNISIFSCDNDKNHEFDIDINTFYNRVKNNTKLCTVCFPINEQKSIKEKELYNFIKSNYQGSILQSYRDGLEIDIYLPDLKLGFEFNGLYWHSDIYKDKNYHLNKLNYFKERGIRIIYIWEDDWINKANIIKSKILNLLGLSLKIGARKCIVREISDLKLTREFLRLNHIQGDYPNIQKSFGLYFNEELVSVMTFDHFEGRKKMLDNEWNLSRFCNKLNYSIVGGSSRLLKYFIYNHKPSRIISYADKDWSNGDLYIKLKFNKLYETNPDYKYIISNVRKHKSGFRKSKTGISESNLTIPKIWDCGKIKYEYNI